jgi:hypothetical protein
MLVAHRPRLAGTCLVCLVSSCMVGLLVLGAGCGSSKQTAKTTPTAPSTSPSTSPVSPPLANPLVLTGTGNQLTQTFNLASGLVVFQISYSGGGPFQAALQDESGKVVSVLSQVNAAITGSTALGVTRGVYAINVTAAGAWQIQVNENVPVNPQFIPVFLQGTGPLVTPFFQSNGGNATVSMNYSGTSAPFVVMLLTSGGNTVSVLANVPNGPFTGTQTVPLQAGVIYIIDVEGTGTWTLSIQ